MNPYYRMLEMMDGTGAKAVFATLHRYDREEFRVEGRRVPIAGRAKGLTLSFEDEGGLFLCLGDRSGLFVLCRLEEV